MAAGTDQGRVERKEAPVREFERAAKRQFINNMMEDDKKKSESDAYQYSSVSAHYDRTELEMSGLDPEELEFMDPEERRETLEDAGLDPDEYDF